MLEIVERNQDKTILKIVERIGIRIIQFFEGIGIKLMF